MRLGHGDGGGGLGGMGIDPNARVLAVLAQMGMAGAYELPDGSIRLPDGRVVGQFRLADGRDGVGTDGTSPGHDGSGFVSGLSRMLNGLPRNVRVMIEGLEVELRGGKKKLQVRTGMWGLPRRNLGDGVDHGNTKRFLREEGCIWHDSRPWSEMHAVIRPQSTSGCSCSLAGFGLTLSAVEHVSACRLLLSDSVRLSDGSGRV